MRTLSPNEVLLDFPAPPRMVRRKPWTGGVALWFVRLFILPHTLVGVYFLFSIPAHLYVRYFGTPLTAVVVDRSATPRKKGGYLYEICYQYKLDGRRYDERTSVGEADYNNTHVGDHLAGRASKVMGDAIFLGPDWQHEGILSQVIVALFVNSILSVFIYGIWIVPLRNRWIVSIGHPAMGVVTGRRTKSGKGTTYIVFYTFSTIDGTNVSGKGVVTNLAYQMLVEGSPITVLYDPKKPKRNLPYDYCEYTIVNR